MKYDIAAKVVMETGKEAILQRFLGLDADSIQIIEQLPEETPSLRRSDFPMRVVLRDGSEVIVLVEIQTEFDNDFILRLIDYTVRFQLKYHLEVIPLVLLLTPSRLATGVYKGKRITFEYNVVRFWELQSRDFLNEMWLYPFLPLMNEGEYVLEEAERKIYEDSEINIEKKADLLTAMAIFAGFKDKDLLTQLIKRRRDIMRQSPAYDIIKEEGLKEGLQQGLQQGVERGRQQEVQRLLLDILRVRFEIIPVRIIKAINSITEIETLEVLHNSAVKCNSVEEFEEKMKLILEE